MCVTSIILEAVTWSGQELDEYWIIWTVNVIWKFDLISTK